MDERFALASVHLEKARAIGGVTQYAPCPKRRRQQQNQSIKRRAPGGLITGNRRGSPCFNRCTPSHQEVLPTQTCREGALRGPCQCVPFVE
jgi:hypothetical protein